MNLPDLTNLETILDTDDDYAALGSRLGDRRDGRVYLHDERIRTAVRVAIATRRPLLLKGDPGSGKSSLAPYIARALKWRFYSVTVTGRTQARDLMWHFDALRRLSDAQVRQPGDKTPSRVDSLEYYIDPKALWWALSPDTAERRGLAAGTTVDAKDKASDPGTGPAWNKTGLPNGPGVVVLIDEIDKADPDVPNNLLEALGSLQFKVQETGFPVAASDAVQKGTAHAPLIMITTNDERELPAAFQRRCVTLYLERHEGDRLVDIASRHFAADAKHTGDAADEARRQTLFKSLAGKFETLRQDAKDKGLREPSTAEYLDATRACLALGIDPDTDAGAWKQISELTLIKVNPFAEQKPENQ